MTDAVDLCMVQTFLSECVSGAHCALLYRTRRERIVDGSVKHRFVDRGWLGGRVVGSPHGERVSMRRVNLSLLGSFHARLEPGPALTFRTKKAQALLAYLVLHPERRPSSGEPGRRVLGRDARRASAGQLAPRRVRAQTGAGGRARCASNRGRHRGRRPCRHRSRRRNLHAAAWRRHTRGARASHDAVPRRPARRALRSTSRPSRTGCSASVSGCASWPSRRWRGCSSEQRGGAHRLEAARVQTALHLARARPAAGGRAPDAHAAVPRSLGRRGTALRQYQRCVAVAAAGS